MRIDAHHHVWRLARGDYGWLDARADPSLRPIARDFGIEEFGALARANGVAGSVLVQAAPTLAETRWLLEQAAASRGLVLGVVGWIDMAAADAPEVLAGLGADPLLRGIRPMLQDLPDARWVLQPALEPAFRSLIAQDLAFDLLVKTPQLDAALELLQRHPDLRAVIDHCAKPDIARGAWQPWAGAMRRLAREPGVHCKLSGLATEAAPGWTTDDLRRYADHLLECFGAERILWGSDWPVALLATDYARWVHAAMQLIGGLPPTQRAMIMGGNAMAFYRLRSAPAQG